MRKITNIVTRIFANLRVYGANATIQKAARRLHLMQRPKSLSLTDFVYSEVKTHDSWQGMCESYFETSFENQIKEADDWYSDWLRWQSKQELQTPERWNAGEYLLKTLYVTVRYLKPNVIVETGTANGASAAAISAALTANKHGILHTYDVCDLKLCLVPDEQKLRIERHIVHNLSEMKKSISNLQFSNEGVSIFFHDSNHSYEHQAWEFELAKNLPFSLLISDDINDSSAFLELASTKKVACVDDYKIIGIAKV